MTSPPIPQLAAIVGASYVSTDADVLAARSVDWTGRYRGRAGALVRPADAAEVAGVLTACREAGVPVTVQGGRTSLVAGTVPEHGDVLLSTERLTALSVDTARRLLRAGAGVTLAAARHAADTVGLEVGVDLAARDSATLGGMASTNAGGLRTVRYGTMSASVTGLEVVLPDSRIVRRHPRVLSDNTGYDLTALFVGAEGTLGVITAVDLRLYPVAAHRTTALCGFAGLGDVLAARERFTDIRTCAALELIDGRAAALARDRLGVTLPVDADWLLLVELAGDAPQTGPMAAALDGLRLAGEAAVAEDVAAAARLWAVRESQTEACGVFGAPLKFDVSVPIPEIPAFAAEAAAVIGTHAPAALPVLFGHIGEGNLHLNVLRCDPAAEPSIVPAVLDVIVARGGNISSEHGVGSRKREYLGMSREPADIAAMRAVKNAFDPTGYLNPAVLFG